MPSYLGIDYGTKRIGLAWANELAIALPIGSIAGIELNRCWEEVDGVVKERSIDEFVVGYPIHMGGEVGVRAREVDQFIGSLSARFNLKVHRVDERLTSVAAEESMSKKVRNKKGRKKPDGRIDATAASLILRDFLNGGFGKNE